MRGEGLYQKICDDDDDDGGDGDDGDGDGGDGGDDDDGDDSDESDGDHGDHDYVFVCNKTMFVVIAQKLIAHTFLCPMNPICDIWCDFGLKTYKTEYNFHFHFFL